MLQSPARPAVLAMPHFLIWGSNPSSTAVCSSQGELDRPRPGSAFLLFSHISHLCFADLRAPHTPCLPGGPPPPRGCTLSAWRGVYKWLGLTRKARLWLDCQGLAVSVGQALGSLPLPRTGCMTAPNGTEPTPPKAQGRCPLCHPAP